MRIKFSGTVRTPDGDTLTAENVFEYDTMQEALADLVSAENDARELKTIRITLEVVS